MVSIDSTLSLADVSLLLVTFPLAHREDIPDTPSLLLLAFRDRAVFTIQVWTFHCFHFSPFIVFTIQMGTFHCSAPISPFNLPVTTCAFSGLFIQVHSGLFILVSSLHCAPSLLPSEIQNLLKINWIQYILYFIPLIYFIFFLISYSLS